MSRALTREDLALISVMAPRFRLGANLGAVLLFGVALVVGHRIWALEGLQASRYWIGAFAAAALGRLAVMPYGCLLYLWSKGIKLSVTELDVLMVGED